MIYILTLVEYILCTDILCIMVVNIKTLTWFLKYLANFSCLIFGDNQGQKTLSFQVVYTCAHTSWSFLWDISGMLQAIFFKLCRNIHQIVIKEGTCWS